MKYFRFPNTPHLAWLGEGQPRDDKVLSSREVETLLAGQVVVEEKIDGANIGFSAGEGGALRVQNRGSYLHRDHAHRQFRPLWSWLQARQSALLEGLGPSRILFGEWCYAVHSVVYTRLPDWFLGFDVYDRDEGVFWATVRRDLLLEQLRLHPVPHVARGHFSISELKGFLSGQSRVGGSALEGLVVRRESDGFTRARAKLVRAEFAQSIDEHWSRGSLQRNAVQVAASSFGQRTV